MINFKNLSSGDNYQHDILLSNIKKRLNQFLMTSDSKQESKYRESRKFILF